MSFIRGTRSRSHLDRFREEARAMAQLEDHPNIVAVYDFGEHHGEPYIVTQYVAGGTLATLLDQQIHVSCPHRA